MAPRRQTTRRQAPKAMHYTSGPWKGTRCTNEPFDDATTLATDAANMYVPDIDQGSGFYARPGFSLDNGGVAVTSAATRFQGQGAFSHTSLAGVTTNFVVFNGELWRRNATGTAYTNVSPSGIAIDNAIGTRVYGTTFADQLIVTDGVHRPWLATNLSASLVTGTYIDFDSSGTQWSAFGPFVVYGGSVFCIINEVNGTFARSDLAWSAAGNAAVGYQQTDYDLRWTLLQNVGQTAPPPLYALAGTNTALIYFRELSIGAISGAVGPDLATSATHDAISQNIGTQMPQCVVQYGIYLYFVDQVGRPYRLVPGGEPEALWLELRQIVDAASIGFPSVTRKVAVGAFEPTLNQWFGASWSGTPSNEMPCEEGYIFDARTGQYVSRLVLADGAQMEAMGNFLDSSGRSTLVILGSLLAPSGSAPATSGYVWTMNALASQGDFLTTEGGVQLTTEDDALLTTEGNDDVNWLDGDVAPLRYVTGPRFGYDADQVLTVDRVTALVTTTSPVSVSMWTSAVTQTVEGTPTPVTTQDGISRIVVGANGIQGRGVRATITATEAPDQFSVQQITMKATVNVSAPDEN